MSQTYDAIEITALHRDVTLSPGMKIKLIRFTQ